MFGRKETAPAQAPAAAVNAAAAPREISMRSAARIIFMLSIILGIFTMALIAGHFMLTDIPEVSFTGYFMIATIIGVVLGIYSQYMTLRSIAGAHAMMEERIAGIEDVLLGRGLVQGVTRGIQRNNIQQQYSSHGVPTRPQPQPQPRVHQPQQQQPEYYEEPYQEAEYFEEPYEEPVKRTTVSKPPVKKTVQRVPQRQPTGPVEDDIPIEMVDETIDDGIDDQSQEMEPVQQDEQDEGVEEIVQPKVASVPPTTPPPRAARRPPVRRTPSAQPGQLASPGSAMPTVPGTLSQPQFLVQPAPQRKKKTVGP